MENFPLHLDISVCKQVILQVITTHVFFDSDIIFQIKKVLAILKLYVLRQNFVRAKHLK